MSASVVEAANLPLPPIRSSAAGAGSAAGGGPSSNGGPSTFPLMAVVSEDPISLWLKLGALEKLEQAVLDGYGDHLYGKTSRIPQVNKFLKQVPAFQGKINEIHKAIVDGKSREVQQLIDHKKLAFCRDHMGASPLHKAVLYNQKDIVLYLLEKYPSVLHARDHQGRTPLHYAAVLNDGGDIYQALLEAGADDRVTDVYGHTPDYYLNTQEELTIEHLKEGAVVNKIKRIKKGNKTTKLGEQRGLSAKPAISKSQVKELLSRQMDLSLLEDLVIQGHGDKLLTEHSQNPDVTEFLEKLPQFLENILDVHRAAIRGRMTEVQELLREKPNLAISRDQLGATPLHKAVLYGHLQASQYLAENYPAALNAKDVDGRTPLHYAAILKDDKEIYYMLLNCGASNAIPDVKGKSPEQMLQHPEQLSLEQIMKRSQRVNATHVANQTTRIKLRSPLTKSLSESENLKALPHGDVPDSVSNDDNQSTDQSSVFRSQRYSRKPRFRSRPPLPPPRLQRLEVTSANLRKWAQEEDIEKLEGAVIQGFADKVLQQKSDSEGLRSYIEKDVPQLMERIEAIHTAISNDDLALLQKQLEKEDYALAKDHMGMTPLHRAVILGREQALTFLIGKFPETVNARDNDGRTALHYAAAKTRRDGLNCYKLLLEAGADANMKDNRGRCPEYYRTHHLPIPTTMSSKLKTALHRRSHSEPPLKRRLLAAPPAIQERITVALKNGDVSQLQELVLEGYGPYVVGRQSWFENGKMFLKTVPSQLSSIKEFHEACASGDLDKVMNLAESDEKLLKARNSDGQFAIHIAVSNDRPQIVKYLVDNFPYTLMMKDTAGRTPLHVSGIGNHPEIYKLLIDCKADPRIMDQRGKTADYYLGVHELRASFLNKSSAGRKSGSSTKKEDIDTALEAEPVVEAPAEQEVPVVAEAEASAEPEAEASAEPEAEASAEPEAESSAKPEAEASEELEVEAPAESEVEAPADAEVEAPADAEVEAPAETEVEAPAETEVEAPAETEVEAPAETEVEAPAETEVEAPAETEVEAPAETEVEAPAETEVEAPAETEVEAPAELEVEGSAEPEVEAPVEHEVELPAEPEVEPAADSEVEIPAEPEVEAPTEPEVEPSAEPGVEASAEPEIEIATEPEVEATAELEVEAPVEPQEEAPTEPEVEAPVEPEVEAPAEPEIEAQAEPEVDVPVEPEVEAPAEPEVEAQAEPEVEAPTESEVDASAEPEVEAPEEPEAEAVAESEAEAAAEQEVEVAAEPEAEAAAEPEAEAAAEPEAEAAADPEAEAAADPEVEAAADPEIEAATEPEIEAAADPEVEAAADPEAEAALEPEAEAVEEPEAEAAAEPEVEAAAEPEVEAAAEPEAEAAAEPEVEAAAEPEAEAAAEPEVEAAAEPQAEAAAEPEVEAAAEPETDVAAEPEVEATAEPETDVAAEPEVEAAAELEAEAAAEPEAEAAAEPEAEAVTEPEAGAAAEPEAGAAAEPDVEVTAEPDVDAAAEPEHETSAEPEVEAVADKEENCVIVLEEAGSAVDQESETLTTQAIESEEESKVNLEDAETDSAIEASDDPSKSEDGSPKDNVSEDSGNATTTDVTPLTEDSKISDLNDVEGEQSAEPPDKAEELAPESSETQKSEYGSEEGTENKSTSQERKDSPEYDRLGELIDKWIAEKDLLRLEHVVIAGQGERLIGRVSEDKQVAEFLNLVPTYMERIRTVHEAVVRGNISEVRTVLTRKRFALSRDHMGAGPLHLAVLHGHTDVLLYIVNQFPETLDGPDNEGRTPLHYASAVQDGGHYYTILKNAGANSTMQDKAGNTPEYYLEHPDALSIRDLLESYRALDEFPRPGHPGSVDLWQRPPTAEIMKRLTPPSDGSATPISPDDESLVEDLKDIEFLIMPVMEDNFQDDFAYTDTFSNALVRGLLSLTKYRPDDPIGFLAALLLQYSNGVNKSASRSGRNSGSGRVGTPYPDGKSSDGPLRGRRTSVVNVTNDDDRLVAGATSEMGTTSRMMSSLMDEELPEEECDVPLDFEDHTKMKDEEGKTVLHFAATRSHMPEAFYSSIGQTEMLLAERDATFKTARDLAEETQLVENVAAIDRYVLDALLEQRVSFLQMLLHEGYDHLSKITNADGLPGDDLVNFLETHHLQSMVTFLQDCSEFQTTRDELHTLIRHNVSHMVDSYITKDASLVTAKNTKGRCALHVAVLFGNLEIIENLVKQNSSSVHVPDNMGRTPMHYAMGTELVDQVGRILIKGGALRSSRDVKMRTPSYYFVYKTEIQDILKEEQDLA